VTSQLYIDGTWRPSSSGQSVAVYAPDNGEVLEQIARGTAADIDAAVLAARRAFEGGWGRTPAFERGRLLSRLAALITANLDELAAIEARDCGKPMKQARADIAVAARYFEFYGGAADKFVGDVVPYLDGFTVMVKREPHGVTGHIIPWNYPAQMFGRSLAPALACGNATVMKPAEEACLSVLRMAQLAQEAGFPAGVINVVTGLGEEAGAALSRHPGIDFISFTGSPEVGTLIQEASAQFHRPCTLELGGKSPQIIFDDADLDAALPVVISALVQNAGQTCAAGSRVLVQKSVADEVVERLSQRFARLRVGTSAMDLDCGPLISVRQRDRVNGFVARAKADGIPLMAAAKLDTALPQGGYFVAPMLFGPVPTDHELANQEVFGPVLALITFDDEAEAIRIANGTEFGLVSAIWTRDGGRQLRVANAVRSGQVFINTFGAGGGVELPFGGMKRSGHGREKGLEALREFSVAKTITIRHG
jgi:aldehyde dehydrogenase (NAD+)